MNNKKAILVVDYDQAFVEKIRLLLSDKKIIHAENYITAYQYLDTTSISLMILEYNLYTYHSGLEIAINVKQNFPLIKIILTSHHMSFELIKASINSNSVDSFINKPVNDDEFTEIVNMTFKQIEQRNKKMESVIEKLINKDTVEDELISEIGGEINLLNVLYSESINKQAAMHNGCVGIVIFKNSSIYIQKYIYMENRIENEYLFAGFIESLIKFALNFNRDSNSHEISIGDTKVQIYHSGEFIYSLFMAGNKKAGDDKKVGEFIELLDKKIRVLSNDAMYESLDFMLVNLNDQLHK